MSAEKKKASVVLFFKVTSPYLVLILLLGIRTRALLGWFLFFFLLDFFFLVGKSIHTSSPLKSLT